MAHELTSGTVKLSQDIATFINNRRGSDVQFKVGGNIRQENGEVIYKESETVTIYAHSNILCCRSKYFATMLDEESNWKDNGNGIIYKPNISPSTFRDVLYYIYTGAVIIGSYENIVELVTLADELSLEELSIEYQERLIEITRYIFSVDSCGDDESDDDSYTENNDDESHNNTYIKRDDEQSDSEDSDDDSLMVRLGDGHSDSEGSNDDSDIMESTNEQSEAPQLSTEAHIPTEEIWSGIIQVLNITTNHPLSYLSQKLFDIILPRISVIIASPDAYTAFLDGVSSESLARMVSSDNIGLTERDIWDLVLDWACRQTKLEKTAIEEHLKKTAKSDKSDNDEYNDEESGINKMDIDTNMEENTQQESDDSVVSIAQLKQLKAVLAPFLPSIRFSLLGTKDYARMIYTLDYFLPRRRLLELQHFFLDPDCVAQLDSTRLELLDIAKSTIVVNPRMWKLLRKEIFKTKGITGCVFPEQLKFDLLFRGTEHGFLATTFHQRCDKKGPTLVLVRSDDGHLFGGVNFVNWHSKKRHSFSPLNFIFALPDGCHRNKPVIFKVDDQSKRSAYNGPASGPNFGGSDLKIANDANINDDSWSNLPCAYDGNGASETALAGSRDFVVSDYEVFAISKGPMYLYL